MQNNTCGGKSGANKFAVYSSTGKKPLLSFIVDFYCPKVKLVIELDGSQHVEPEHLARDNERDVLLFKAGLKVLRFNDRQVLSETAAVLEVIYAEVVERLKR